MADEAQHSYKWDVAISLLDKDLSFAQSLYNGLQERFSVFLYSEAQKELQFRDGLEVFSDNFRRDARVVVVLWRDEWAKSKWTGVEQRAIKDRVFEEGPEFLVLVKMESGVTPTWVPQTYIYRQEDGWNVSTLIENVAGQVNRLGGEIRKLTPVELAKLHKAERDWRGKRQSVLASQSASDARTSELALLQTTIKTYIAEIGPDAGGRAMEFEVRPRQFGIIKYPCTVRVTEVDDFQSVDAPRQISVEEWDGVLSLKGERNNRIAPTREREQDYSIDVNQNGDWFWRNTKSNEVFTTAKLADDIMNHLLSRTNKYEKGELKRRRKNGSDPLDDDDNYQRWPQFR